MLNSSYLSSEQVSLFSIEWWAAINRGIQVTSKHFLHHPCAHDMLWFGIWKLDPVTHQVVGYPEYGGVNTLSSKLLELVGWDLLGFRKDTLGNPVIILGG